jgi:hypothetical protein
LLEEFIDFLDAQMLQLKVTHCIRRQLKAALLGYHAIDYNISRNIPSFFLSRSPTRYME